MDCQLCLKLHLLPIKGFKLKWNNNLTICEWKLTSFHAVSKVKNDLNSEFRLRMGWWHSKHTSKIVSEQEFKGYAWEVIKLSIKTAVLNICNSITRGQTPAVVGDQEKWPKAPEQVFNGPCALKCGTCVTCTVQHVSSCRIYDVVLPQIAKPLHFLKCNGLVNHTLR